MYVSQMMAAFFAIIFKLPYITRLVFLYSMPRVGGLWGDKVQFPLRIYNLRNRYILITEVDWLQDAKST